MSIFERASNNYVADYLVSGGFAVFGIIQLAVEDLSGIGMLAISAFAAWSTHDARKRKNDYDKQVATIEDGAKKREAALEARIKLLIAGIPCDHSNCPVIEVAKGQIEAMDRIKLPASFPFDRHKNAGPSEDTVDVP